MVSWGTSPGWSPSLPGAGVTPINRTVLLLCSLRTSPTESHRFPSLALGITTRPSSSLYQPQVCVSRDSLASTEDEPRAHSESAVAVALMPHTHGSGSDCSLQLLPTCSGAQNTVWAGRSSTDNSIGVAGAQRGHHQPFTPAWMKVPPQPAVGGAIPSSLQEPSAPVLPRFWNQSECDQ